MTTLRILHVDSARQWLGGQSQVRSLIMGLQRVPGIQQVLAATEGSPLATEAHSLGVPLVPLRWETSTDPRALRSLVFQARRSWDIVHAHDSDALRVALVALALEGSGASLVASRPEAHPVRTPWKWRRAHVIVAGSRAVRRVLIGQGLDRRRIEVVHGGVAAEDVRPARAGLLKEVAAAGAGHLLVGAIGELVPERDHGTLIRAAARVVKLVPQARFAIFGNGPERPWLERLIEEMGLGGRVCLPGRVPEATKALNDLSVFVPSSGMGGFGMACLQAMAAGVPVVATTGGAVQEIAGESIALVRPGDPDALAMEIARLLASRKARGQAVRTGQVRASMFTVERMVERTLAVYERALQSGRSSAPPGLARLEAPPTEWAESGSGSRRAEVDGYLAPVVNP